MIKTKNRPKITWLLSIILSVLFFPTIVYAAEDLGVDPPASNVVLTDAFSVISGYNSYIHPTNKQQVVITQDKTNQRGGLWYKFPINLTKPFDFEAEVYMGDKPSAGGGADGITFTFQNDTRKLKAIGNLGGGLGAYGTGAAGIQNAISLEIDTYRNTTSGDYDGGMGKDMVSHTALVIPTDPMGMNKHMNLQILTNDYFTQRKWIPIKIKWEPVTKMFTYTIGSLATQSYSLDPITLFGSQEVYWGFTGSTGGSRNFQSVTITKLPQEPQGELEKFVRNVSRSETNFAKSTIAKPGEILEYKISITNKEESIVPYVKTKALETLENSEIVPGSFQVDGVTASDPTLLDGKFTFNFATNYTGSSTDPNVINEHELKQGIKPGETKVLTFKVKVLSGLNNSQIKNKATIQSAFSSEKETDEVVTYIEPSPQIVKQANKSTIKWGTADMTITYQLELKNADLHGEWNGVVTDSLEANLALVSGQTTLKKSTDAVATNLPDSCWQNSRDFLSPQISLKGGESVVITFKATPLLGIWDTKQVKNQANAVGYDSTGKLPFNATSNEVVIPLNAAKLHIRQVILDPVEDLVIPSQGYIMMSRRFNDDLNKEKAKYGIHVGSGTNFAYPDFTTVKLQLTSDSLVHLIQPIVPSFYQYIGYVVTTDDKMEHNLIKMTESNQPLELDYRIDSEYYVTVFLRNTVKVPPFYNWDHKLNHLVVS